MAFDTIQTQKYSCVLVQYIIDIEHTWKCKYGQIAFDI